MGIDRDTGANTPVPRPTLAMPLLPMTCITALTTKKRGREDSVSLGRDELTRQSPSNLSTSIFLFCGALVCFVPHMRESAISVKLRFTLGLCRGGSGLSILPRLPRSLRS
jgi:hypothetical protein